MNSNPTNATQDAVNGNERFPKVTTQELGIAIERDRDLAGYVLSPQEISTAVVKFLMCYNIDDGDIYSVKVGTTKDEKLKIIAEVKAKALGKKKSSHNWMDFEEYSNEETVINDIYYSAWRNKLFHGKNKNLQIKKISRNKDKYVSISIDPEIFLAFVYDINFCDKLYKISAPAARWKSNKQLDDMSGKERKRYKAMQQEFANFGITHCRFVVVTFAKESVYRTDTAEIKGFHPQEVEDFYSNNKD